MFEYVFDKKHKVVGLKPSGVMTHEDFEQARLKLETFVHEEGKIAGVLIQPPDGYKHWDTFNGLIGQLKLRDNQHRMIPKVAVVSNVPMMTLINRISSHFAHADVQEFAQLGPALRWVVS